MQVRDNERANCGAVLERRESRALFRITVLGNWMRNEGEQELGKLPGFQPEGSAPVDTRNTSGRRVWRQCRRIHIKSPYSTT